MLNGTAEKMLEITDIINEVYDNYDYGEYINLICDAWFEIYRYGFIGKDYVDVPIPYDCPTDDIDEAIKYFEGLGYRCSWEDDKLWIIWGRD